MKAKLLALAFAAMLSLSFSVSVLGATQEELSGMYGGDFKIAVTGTALELNPKLAADDASWGIIDLLYDSLGRMNPVTLEVIPWVADSWTVDAGTGEVTVMLDPSAEWHDGSSVTASDVEYTYETFYGGYNVNVVSPTEAVFTFTTGGGKFMTEGLQKPLVKSMDANPTEGCGPFEFIEKVANDHVTIGAYDGYFQGRPYLDTIEFIVYSGIATAAHDLIDQTIDMIGWKLGANDPTDIRDVGGENKTIIDQEYLAVINSPGFEFLYFGYNPIDEMADLDFRLAVSKFINKDLYLSIEPNTFVTHSPMTKYNAPWFNPDVTTFNSGYFYDITGRQSTNYYEGLHALESLGYFDTDCDGWREKPGGAPLAMTLLGPELTVDLRKNTIATDLAVLLSNMDLNVDMETTGDPATFDIYLGIGELGLEPSAIGDIPMLADYSIAELDTALDAADDALDPAERQMYVFEALQIISDQVPFMPLLMYDAIEAYNRATFGGWVEMVGGVNNFWSFKNLHYLMAGSLDVSVMTDEMSLDASGSTRVVVRVLDASGTPVEYASVELTADGGTFAAATGLTDSLGEYETDYDAPAAVDVSDVAITATAFMPAYSGSSATTTVTVHPAPMVLNVAVGRLASIVDSGTSTSVTVAVTDQDGLAVDCDIHMSVDQAGATLGTPTAGANPGEFTASFVGNVTVDTNFKVTVVALQDGYETGTGFTDIVVRRWGGMEPEETTKIESVPDVGILAVISVTLVAVLVIAYRRREH